MTNKSTEHFLFQDFTRVSNLPDVYRYPPPGVMDPILSVESIVVEISASSFSGVLDIPTFFLETCVKPTGMLLFYSFYGIAV